MSSDSFRTSERERERERESETFASVKWDKEEPSVNVLGYASDHKSYIRRGKKEYSVFTLVYLNHLCVLFPCFPP